MQITRSKATALLNKGEMGLYDDSRHNPIRGFTSKQLESRIKRARGARDRARDLVRRQKLASRERTGSKRGTSGAANQRTQDKVEILADILRRFEARLKVVKAEERERERASKKAATKKAARKTATKKTAAKKAPAKKASKKAVKKAARKVTAKQALRSTRKVLEAKQEEARQAKAWQNPSAQAGQVEGEGFQSRAAARRARELHAAETRMPAIHGSAGTRGRINQGKRDSKGGGD